MFTASLPPTSWFDVAILPALAVFFGALAFVLGLRNQLSGGKAYRKWVGHAIMVFGVYAGFGPFWNYVDNTFEAKAYQGSPEVAGRKMLIAHWGGSLIPVVFVIAALFTDFWTRRNRAAEEC